MHHTNHSPTYLPRHHKHHNQPLTNPSLSPPQSQKTTHTYRGATAPLTSLALLPHVPPSSSSSPSQTLTLFAGCWNKHIYAWDAATRALLRTYTGGHTDFVKSVAVARISGPASSASQSSSAASASASLSTTGGPAPTEILISGGADGLVIIWSVATGEKLHVLGAHSRGVLDLAVDPASYMILVPDTTLSSGTGSGSETFLPTPNSITLFSASSLGDIRVWRVSYSRIEEATSITTTNGTNPDDSKPQQSQPLSPITAHNTSVNRLHFPTPFPSSLPFPTSTSHPSQFLTSSSSSDYDHQTLPNLYTASSDKTSLLLPRSTSFHPLPSPPTQSQTKSQTQSQTQPPPLTLTHPDWVRDILTDPSSNLIITACRDEDIRVWEVDDDIYATSRAGGQTKAPEVSLLGTLSGHWDSVEALCLVAPAPSPTPGPGRGGRGGVGAGRVGDGKGAKRLVSGGMDCTLRIWSLDVEEVEKVGREWGRWVKGNLGGGRGGGGDDEDDDDDELEDDIKGFKAEMVGGGGGKGEQPKPEPKTKSKPKPLTTEDEDRELAALMAELEDDD